MQCKKYYSTIWYDATRYRVSHETWELMKCYKCLLSQFVKLFEPQENNIKFFMAAIFSKIDFKVKYIWVKDLFNEINCIHYLISNTVFGRRHSKPFINSHVSWDTLYFVGATCLDWNPDSLCFSLFDLYEKGMETSKIHDI